MKRLATGLAAVLAIAVASTMTATGAAENTHESTHTAAPLPAKCTAKAFRPFSAAVWRLIRWERGKPPTKVIQAQRHRLSCAGPLNRRAMRKRWSRDHHRYVSYRRSKLAEQRQLAAISPPGSAWLASTRACESGDDYATNTGNGFYGAYQFDLQTWASVGGTGLPSDASPAEQDYRAALLYRSRGSSPWPVCG